MPIPTAIRQLCIVTVTFGSFLLSPQAAVAADPAHPEHMLYFDVPVGFPSFHQLTVYRAWDDPKAFFFLPTGLQQEPAGISFHYRKTRGGLLEGSLVLSVRPAFDEDEFRAVSAELKQIVPDGRFVLSEPSMSEIEVLGLGLDRTVTPPLMSNPLLSSTSVSIEIPDGLSRILLNSGSNYASAFVVRHKFAIRGIEVDDAMVPHVTTRWFSRGVSFPGGCSAAPERYVNLNTGRAGCLFEVTFARPFVKEIQTLLRGLTLYQGAIDGIAGTRTRLAIRSFQDNHGMLEDGEISSILLQKLRETKP